MLCWKLSCYGGGERKVTRTMQFGKNSKEPNLNLFCWLPQNFQVVRNFHFGSQIIIFSVAPYLRMLSKEKFGKQFGDAQLGAYFEWKLGVGDAAASATAAHPSIKPRPPRLHATGEAQQSFFCVSAAQSV